MVLGVDDVNFKFFENNRDTLIQLSISERRENGFGVTIIDMTESKTNVDVKYLPINHPHLSEKIRKDIITKKEKVPDSVLFFCLMLNGDNLILEIDLGELK
jgi:hypothetical protein